MLEMKESSFLTIQKGWDIIKEVIQKDQSVKLKETSSFHCAADNRVPRGGS